MMKSLSVVGTAAMFLVGGGILIHGIPPLHQGIESLAVGAGALVGLGGLAQAVLPTVFNGIFGVVAGALVLAGVMAARKLRA